MDHEIISGARRKSSGISSHDHPRAVGLLQLSAGMPVKYPRHKVFSEVMAPVKHLRRQCGLVFVEQRCLVPKL